MENLDIDFAMNITELDRNSLVELYKEIDTEHQNACSVYVKTIDGRVNGNVEEALLKCKQLESKVNFVANKVVRSIIEEGNLYMKTTSELFPTNEINTTQKYIEEGTEVFLKRLDHIKKSR